LAGEQEYKGKGASISSVVANEREAIQLILESGVQWRRCV